ncbi:phage tail protein [Arsenophonus nasoniae]|uniref:phage tail protein n=2 Tax=Arsenophonus nasoniae TaxID=638 RepID=UPI00387A5A33
MTHLYQNGIAEYAEKQIYNKGAVCLSDGNIYLSKTENNAGNPVTDTTQWQSLKDAILAANIVQQLGNATDKVISQKGCTEILAKKKSQEAFYAGGIIINYANPRLSFKITEDNSMVDFVLDPDSKTLNIDGIKSGVGLEYRVQVPKSNGTLALTNNPTKIAAPVFQVKSPSTHAYIELIAANGNTWRIGSNNNDQRGYLEKIGKFSIYFPEKAGTLALTSDINIPVGSPIPWPQATPPAGYLVCNGQTFNKTTCPQLATVYPSGKLPDLQGQFIRGLDLGGKVDKGRAALSTQGDAIRNMRGSYTQRAGSGQVDNVIYPNITNAKGVFRSVLNKTSGFHTLGIVNPAAEEMVNFDASFEVPTANENRPKNIAFLYIVRAA